MRTLSLGPWVFEGAVTPARERHTGIVGHATFDGVIGWIPWPVERVRAWLPADLEPCPATAGPSGLHPVLIALGRQRDTAVVYGGIRWEVGVAYDEALVSVPCVRRVGGTQLHMFIPVMLSGSHRATWSGNTHYGFAKRMGRVARFGDVWVGTEDGGGLTVEVVARPGEAWSPVQDGGRTFTESIRRLLEAPVLGRRRDGAYVGAYFEWGFDAAHARGVDLGVTVREAGVACDAACTSSEAAIEVRGMRWRLGWPEAPRF